MGHAEPENELGLLYLQDALARMQGVRELGEAALRQLLPEHWHATLTEGENSVAILVQHLSGNMHSRWEHLLEADGESGSRDRDAEFKDAGLTPEQLWNCWNAGWEVFLGVLTRLQPADLTRSLTIRGEMHTVLEAIQRQVAHYSGHVYQLVFLARHWLGADWQTLSIARGQSREFNRQMEERRRR
ncbi:DUF1572 family protein [Deinococcus altitudinis]|uniref:DUF1572 family protein n=1 Tax=Deinococcus altitudinis TaxID=468914 RepID=UPI003891234C